MRVYQPESAPQTSVILLDEELTESNSPCIWQAVSHMSAEGSSTLILDCSRLQFVTSYGLAILLRIHKMIGEAVPAGQSPLMALAGPNRQVVTSIHEAQLDAVFAIYSDLDSALRCFEQQAAAC